MNSRPSCQRGFLALPAILLACVLAMVAAWGMRSKAPIRLDTAVTGEEIPSIGVMAERSEAASFNPRTRIQLVGAKHHSLVELLSQTQLSDQPNFSVIVPAESQIAIRVTPDSYRVHVTPVDPNSKAPLQADPKSVAFVEVGGSPFIIDLSRLSTNRLPFPRAGS